MNHNPYTQSVDQCNNLAHTGMVCDYLAALMSDRPLTTGHQDYPEKWDELLNLGVPREKLTHLAQAFRNLDPKILAAASECERPKDEELEGILCEIEKRIKAHAPITGDANSVG